MKPSDSKYFSQLSGSIKTNPPQLSPDEIYRACVVAANNGVRRIEEGPLESLPKTLLEIRRTIQKNDLAAAQADLDRVADNTHDFLLAGDQRFLRGIVLHRGGRFLEAAREFTAAADVFQKQGEIHRYFRSLINAKVCDSHLGDYSVGELFALEQATLRADLPDLRGNIQKSRAVECLRLGKFDEAVTEARRAAESYSYDGCPEDRAIALALASIGSTLQGDQNTSQECLAQIHHRSPKIQAYLDIQTQLARGKTPSLANEHPLAGTEWSLIRVKHDSVTGKLVQTLQRGPRTRDELIVDIWGSRATDPSYCNRLYAAVNHARKKMLVQIVFDGTRYKLPYHAVEK